MAQPVPLPKPAGNATIINDVLYIEHLEERDPEVVNLINEADSMIEAAQQCLRIGARAIRAASVSVDTDIIDRKFGDVTDRMSVRVESAVEQISEVTTVLLDDEHGALTIALQSHSAELGELFGTTFDPNSKKGVFGILETVLKTAHQRQVDEVRKLVSAAVEDSPIAIAKREIIRSVRDEFGEIRRDVQTLSEKIVVRDAVAPVYEITSGKGFDFEDVVHDRVALIAARHGDVSEQVGTEKGLAGNQKGDEVVTINRDDVVGAEVRVVMEVKARKLNMRTIIAELDEAIMNRGALAAVAVFSDQRLAPTSAPFQYADNKAIVVLDSADVDSTALELAYMWARWVARRSLTPAGADEIDHARIAVLIEDASRSLERATSIKRFHTQAKKSIDQAAYQVGCIVDEVAVVLDQLAAEIDRGAEK